METQILSLNKNIKAEGGIQKSLDGSNNQIVDYKYSYFYQLIMYFTF